VEQLRVRCPACQKLYQVETSAIYSLTPHFECRACGSVFAFEFPPENPEQVQTFLVRQKEAEAPAEEPSLVLQAQPSLVQMWNNIFEDYEDEERHEDFIKRCSESDALAFAKMKYEDLRAATGDDPVCEKFLKQIDALMSVKAEMSVQAQKAAEPQEFLKWLQQQGKNFNWLRVLYWTPLAITLFMVILGFSNKGMRNMIGVGVFFAFISYGLITLFRGRIRLSDFLK
jgi:hypothetical protein